MFLTQQNYHRSARRVSAHLISKWRSQNQSEIFCGIEEPNRAANVDIILEPAHGCRWCAAVIPLLLKEEVVFMCSLDGLRLRSVFDWSSFAVFLFFLLIRSNGIRLQSD